MNGKRIVVTGHARFEMQRRAITMKAITDVIRRPDQVIPSRRGREIRQSLTGARRRTLLRVVVSERATVYHVVTAYKTTKIAKYWATS